MKIEENNTSKHLERLRQQMQVHRKGSKYGIIPKETQSYAAKSNL